MVDRNRAGYEKGDDASYMKPKLISDFELLPRDDSGGPEFKPYNAEFGDGGEVTGDKAHLSVRGGKDDPEHGDEINTMPMDKAKTRAGSSADSYVSAKSKSMSRK